MAVLLEVNVELVTLFNLGVCSLAASMAVYIELSPVLGVLYAGLAFADTN
jgi:Kef-type K+ transport system membrane component KefB